MNLAELRQRLKALLAENRTILEASEELTEDQETTLKANKAEIDSIRAKIDELADLTASESYLEGLSAGVGRRTEHLDITGGEPRLLQDPDQGFNDLGEFGAAVAGAAMALKTGDGQVDERLRTIQAADPGSGTHREGNSEDGYLVPPQMRQTIMQVIDEIDGVHNQVFVEPTVSNHVEMLADESTPWGSAGVKAYRIPELGQLTSSRQNLEPREIKVPKLAVLVKASEELIQDAPRLQHRLTFLSGQALAWKLGEEIFYGTGVGQCLGFQNSTAVISQTKETAQTADTIVAENVAKMYSRMIPSSLRRARWYVNMEIIPQLMTMTIGDKPIYLPPGGFSDAPFGLLLGRPIEPTQHAKGLGDLGDIVFMDPQAYYMPRRSSGPRYATSMHLYFDYDAMAFRWTWRVGGAPFLENPISPAYGNNSLSSFVTLEERA